MNYSVPPGESGSLKPTKFMGYTPPEKIEITSCGSVLELDQVLPKSNTRPIAMYVYKYTKSLENLGRVTSLTEEYITKQLKNYFREI